MRGYFFIFLLFSPAFLYAQDAGFTVTADKEKIFIGEQIKLTITAKLPANSTVNWPDPDSLPHFEILQKAKIDTQASGNEWVMQQVLTITSWDSGNWKLNVLPRASVKPLSIAVGYSPMDPNQDYHDIKDIVAVKKPSRVTWYWYLLALALIIVLFILLFPRSKKEKSAVPVSDPAAYQKALRDLEALNSRTGEESKKFYTELLTVFRTYLYKRKGVRSHSKTTEDLAFYLQDTKLRPGDFSTALQSLQAADLARFAKYNPGKTEKSKDIESIKQTIIELEKDQ